MEPEISAVIFLIRSTEFKFSNPLSQKGLFLACKMELLGLMDYNFWLGRLTVLKLFVLKCKVGYVMTDEKKY